MDTVAPTLAPAPSSAPTAREPEVTVLVPVLDEADTVEELAARVAAVLDGLGRSFEIVFVDDGSRDGTAERVRDGAPSATRGSSWCGCAATSARRRRSRAGFDHCARAAGRHHGRRPPGRSRRRSRACSRRSKRGTSTWSRAGSGSGSDPASKTLPVAALQLGDAPRGAGRRSTTSTAASRSTAARCSSRSPIYGELHRYIPVLASRRGFRVGEIAGAPPSAPARRHRSTAGTASTRGCST